MLADTRELPKSKYAVDMSAYNCVKYNGRVYFSVPELCGWVDIDEVHNGWVQTPVKVYQISMTMKPIYVAK